MRSNTGVWELQCILTSLCLTHLIINCLKNQTFYFYHFNMIIQRWCRLTRSSNLKQRRETSQHKIVQQWPQREGQSHIKKKEKKEQKKRKPARGVTQDGAEISLHLTPSRRCAVSQPRPPHQHRRLRSHQLPCQWEACSLFMYTSGYKYYTDGEINSL